MNRRSNYRKQIHVSIYTMIARNVEEIDMTDSKSGKEQLSHKSKGKSSDANHWFSIPQPVRRVFDQFPLLTYEENPLPQRAKSRPDKHTLFIFANHFDTSGVNLSCNPACLKWQVYLRCNGIQFSVNASNNHASPSGSLPFLLPAVTAANITSIPVPASKILRWTSQQVMKKEDVLSMEQEAYLALVDHNIRNSWLYHLYLNKTNFNALAHPLYVATTSSNRFVQMAIAYQLQEAARYELLKSRHIIDGDEVYSAAKKAFSALAVLLGDRNFFSGTDRPGLFDASVFAYTHLLLDQDLPWADCSLTGSLREYPELVKHRDRLLKLCLDD